MAYKLIYCQSPLAQKYHLPTLWISQLLIEPQIKLQESPQIMLVFSYTWSLIFINALYICAPAAVSCYKEDKATYYLSHPNFNHVTPAELM